MMEQRPSLPRMLKLPLVHRPTMAFLPSAKAASASMRASKPVSYTHLERVAAGRCEVHHIGKVNGTILKPGEIYKKIREVAR